MSNHALMEKDGARMNVPADKVEAYKLEGWIVIDSPPEPTPVLQAKQIKPQAESPAEEVPDQSPVNVDDAVEKIRKRKKARRA